MQFKSAAIDHPEVIIDKQVAEGNMVTRINARRTHIRPPVGLGSN